MSRRRDPNRVRQQSAGPSGLGRRPGTGGTIPAEALEKRPGFQSDGLKVWEIQAFYLGALCAVEPEYGPKIILDSMRGDEGWWEDIDHVMGFSRQNAGLWGLMAVMQGRCAMPLHRPEVSDPPTLEELRAWVHERQRGNQRFMEGMGISQKPEELDARNKELLGELARLEVELAELDRALRRQPPKDEAGLRAVLAGLERQSLRLADLFFRLGCHSLAQREEHYRQDGMMGPDYMPCPCGSGRIRALCHPPEADAAG
jgi:hypothetical protein